MVTRCFRDAGEAGLGGLKAGHGAHVVEAVEDLVVEHQLRLVLRVRQVVPHVRTLTTQTHSIEIAPLKNIRPNRLSDMGTLDALSIMADNRSLCAEILLPLCPTSTNSCDNMSP